MSAEPPSSSGLPGRSRPSLSDLSKETTEGDLWNLDDEVPNMPRLQPTPPPTAATAAKQVAETPEAPASEGSPRPRGKTPAQDLQRPLSRPSERPVRADEIGDLEETREQAAEKVVVARFPDEPVDSMVSPAAALPPEIPETVETEDLPAPVAKENKPRSATRPPTGTPLRRPRLNRREVLGLAAFAVVLLAATLWVLGHFFSQLTFKSQFVETPDFPVKGQHAALASADTFWREPVRTGESRDVARREVIMIPVLELSLDPEGSPGGALRVIFRGSEGEPVGDPITRSFAAGRFDASGDARITFPATDGFVEEGSFNAYRTGKGEPWFADVLEGPSVDAPASSFKKLAPIPVLPLRR